MAHESSPRVEEEHHVTPAATLQFQLHRAARGIRGGSADEQGAKRRIDLDLDGGHQPLRGVGRVRP
jgi:hypothetical protein